MKTGAALAVAVIATGCLTHPAGAAMMGPAPIVVDGFQTPESVLYDARGDVYLISNINGNPTAADGNGFISKVSPAGRMIARAWIDGATARVTTSAPRAPTRSTASIAWTR